MPRLRASIHVDATPEEVWAAIGDFGNIYRWNPGVPASHLTSDQGEGVGATRHCDLALPGASIEERVTAWEPGRYYRVDIYDKKRVPFVKNLRAEVGVEPAPGGGAIAYFAPSWETAAGPLGRLVDRYAIRPQYDKGGRAFVAGLKHFVEHGEDVAKGVRLPVDQATVV